MMFNINENVKVKLTDFGRKVHREEHESLCAALDKAWEYHAPREDKNGWSKWRMWDLMATFGTVMTFAGPVPFETTIEIVGDN